VLDPARVSPFYRRRGCFMYIGLGTLLLVLLIVILIIWVF
jgi:hypothetical protein